MEEGTVHNQRKGHNVNLKVFSSFIFAVLASSSDAAVWRVGPTTGGFDAGFALSAKSTAPVDAWLTKVRPELMFQCDKKGIRLWLTMDTSLAYGGAYGVAKVRARIDGGKPATESWTESSSHGTYGAPGSPKYLAALTKAKLVEFEVTPHNSGPVTIAFDLTDFPLAVADFNLRCKR